MNEGIAWRFTTARGFPILFSPVYFRFYLPARTGLPQSPVVPEGCLTVRFCRQYNIESMFCSSIGLPGAM